MNSIATERDRIGDIAGMFVDLDRGAPFNEFRHRDFEEFGQRTPASGLTGASPTQREAFEFCRCANWFPSVPLYNLKLSHNIVTQPEVDIWDAYL